MPDERPFDLAGCLERARRGEQAAARELVEHLYPGVIRIVRAHLPRRVPEEDLAQEIFLKMFTRIAQYSGAVPVDHWVSRIAITTCIDHLRAQKRRPEIRWADLSEPESLALEAAMADGEAEVPGDAFAARELVGRLLGQLNPADRAVIQLLDLEGKSVAEVSALTGWSRPLVKVRAFRARRKLRKLFSALESEETL